MKIDAELLLEAWAEVGEMARLSMPSQKSRRFWSQRRCYKYFERMGKAFRTSGIVAAVCYPNNGYCFEAAEFWQCKQKAVDDFKHEYALAATGKAMGVIRADCYRNLYLEIGKGGTFQFCDFSQVGNLENAKRTIIKALALAGDSLAKHGGGKCQRLLIRAS